MKKRILAVLACLTLVVCILSACGRASNEEVVILYENDVHCAVDGYSKLAALKRELQTQVDHVGVVSAGDYVQGGSFGTVSRGEYIIELMNLVGYDAVALGNHEFDFRMERLHELVGLMDTKPICCNLVHVESGESLFRPYTIVSYGAIDIAYIGVTTHETIVSSSPAQFKDESGNYIYSFNAQSMHDIVQQSIDAARADGADYVIALTHIGYNNSESAPNVIDLIENTDGLDVVLDGHSHDVIESMAVTDEGGNTVYLSSTGTKFAYIGKLTIRDGSITTELVDTESYTAIDPMIHAYLTRIEPDYRKLSARKIATSEVDLIMGDENGKRLARTQETNLGNLCADTYRVMMDADVAYVSGGGLRAPIARGDVTLEDLLGVYPFNNEAVLCEVTGQQLLDLLEFATRLYPEECGSFPHVSGLTYKLDISIKSGVVTDEYEAFAGVNGAYRVYDVRVLDKQSGEYLPLDLTRTYTLASNNYYLLEQGDGMSMLEGAQVLVNNGTLDIELLEQYVTERLGGHIGAQYATTRHALTITEGRKP